MPLIQKPFNSKELRKKEAQLRNKYNHAIKAVEALELPIAPKIVKQLQDAFMIDFNNLVKSHAETPAGQQETAVDNTFENVLSAGEGTASATAGGSDIPE